MLSVGEKMYLKMPTYLLTTAYYEPSPFLILSYLWRKLFKHEYLQALVDRKCWVNLQTIGIAFGGNFAAAFDQRIKPAV